MNVENTTTEGVTDIIKVEIKLEHESDDEVDSELNLYTDHVIKKEMVIGPVVLQPVVYTAYRPEDVPVPKEPKLETTDEEEDQVKPHNVKKKDSTEGASSNVDFKNNSCTNIKINTKLINNEQTNSNQNLQKCDQTSGISTIIYKVNGKTFRKKIKFAKISQKEKPQMEIKEDNTNTEGIISNVDSKKNLSTINIKTNTTSINTKQTIQKCNQTPALSEKVIFLKCILIACNERGTQFQQKCKLPQQDLCHKNKFTCPHCDYKCERKCYLSRHLRLHTDDKPYSCSYCDYKCKLKGQLLTHLRSHTWKKPYSCSHCDYKCKRKVDLLTHLRTHTDEKPYSCPHCDYKCDRKCYLSRHLHTHSDNKSYSCSYSYCDYKCKRKGHLSRHLRFGTGVKPYSCSHCYYKCKRKGDLSRHLRIHTRDISYSCSHCDYKSDRKSSLSLHLALFHAGEISE